jgi:hypothetical protein
MIYLMSCRKGLSTYPLLLFVVITNKKQSHHRIGALVAESLTKDLLLAVIQQRLLGVSEIINSNKDLYSVSQNTEVEILIGDMNVGTAYLIRKNIPKAGAMSKRPSTSSTARTFHAI